MGNETHGNGRKTLFIMRPIKQSVQKRIQTAVQYFFPLKLHFLVLRNKRNVLSALCVDVRQSHEKKLYNLFQ